MAGAIDQRKQWREVAQAPEAAPDIASERVPEPAPPADLYYDDAFEDAPAPHRAGAIFAGTLAILLALGWIAALVAGVYLASPPGGPGLLRIAAWIGLGSAPLALLAILAVLLLRSGRSEATAYARAARALRAESQSLAAMLGLLTRRIEAARTSLADQTQLLDGFGTSASERLVAAGRGLRADADQVARTAALLDDSAAAARTDLGVLLTDLPQAEALAAALGGRLRELAREADAQSGTLGQRIEHLEGAARDADQSSAGAARRLAAELERIEGAAAAADRRIGDAAGRLAEASALALGDSATALDEVRRGIDAQNAALVAVAAHARATLDRSGDEAGGALAERLDALARSLEAMETRLRGHEGATLGLVGRLDTALAAVETRFAALGDHGAEHTADLAEAIVALSSHADQVGRTLGQSHAAADALVARAAGLREHVEASTSALGEAMPAALARLRLHAEQGLKAIDDAGPRVDRLAATAEAVAGRLGETDAAIARQHQAIDAFGQSAATRLADLTRGADAFHALLVRTDADLRNLAEGASVQLVDALLRVKDTAAQAAERAREALAVAIPAAARQLGDDSARAMSAALEGVGTEHVAAVGEASARAVAAAQAAADRLGRQLATIGESAAAIEARVGQADDANFARQVGLLIEGLNSSSIDVAKIFSNEPTDTAWAAYLKGDRGVFTRRAVHLLDAADARTIAARYGDDPEFRDQVNRYIHDFETMLRRVLAVREGAPMGVTLLSSDTGKLYVALAQAIERLRR